MAVKKISTSKKTSKVKQGSSTNAVIVHRLGSLLHTMRSIQQHEQELCTLKHYFERESSPGSDVMEELEKLLDMMPNLDYTDDLTALQETVGRIKRGGKQKARTQTS